MLRIAMFERKVIRVSCDINDLEIALSVGHAGYRLVQVIEFGNSYLIVFERDTTQGNF